MSVIAMAGVWSTFLAEMGVAQRVATPPTTVFVPVSRGPFYVRSYLGKCLTLGGTRQTDPGGTAPPATAVFMDECNQVPGGAVMDRRPQRVIGCLARRRHEGMARRTPRAPDTGAHHPQGTMTSLRLSGPLAVGQWLKGRARSPARQFVRGVS